MALTIREDESEAGGYAFIDLGRPLAVESVRLSFRRQDSEPRFLGLEGWQPEAAWVPAELVPERGPNAVVRVGPTVVDWIDELVPVEVSAEGVGSLGVVVWPHLTRSPRRLTELRLGARAPRSEQPPSAPARPPRAEPAPQPIAPAVTASAVPTAQPAAQAKAEPTKAPEPAKKKSNLRLALVAAAIVAVVVLVSAPFALARLGYHDLVVEARGPLFFLESRPAGATATQFTPATTVLEVRRAGWARWFEGWWLKDPPPAVPVVKDGWLVARSENSDAGAARFVIAPEPRAFPAGQARVQTTVSVRNPVSGATTEATTFTLRRAAGRPQVASTGPISFKGPTGGPMTPNRVAFRLSAVGLGFHWSSEGTVPAWLELTPSQGDLADNGSVEIVATLRPAAALLGPGKYESQLVFRAGASGEFAEQAAHLLIEPRAAPPPGRLIVETAATLAFAGPQHGPFTPQKVPMKVKAAGTGFKWSAEGVPPWLELSPAQGELRDNGIAEVAASLRPMAGTMTPGSYEVQFLVRKTGSGDTVTETARLVIGPPLGQLKVEAPTPLAFAGPQGGPFAPTQMKLQLKAVGKGFDWAADNSNYLQVSPAQGKIADNGSIEVEVKPAAGAQALTPGTYSTPLTFRKKEPGDPAVQNVRLVVTISFR
jgi:hypothetical protein